MRISRKNSQFRSFDSEKNHRINYQIKSPQVRLIDENGQNLGVMAGEQAIEIAKERELDLIEVSPLANPPVVRIQDFNKLRYQEEKERRKEKAKQKKIEVKGIRLSLRISEHDIDTRVNQSQKFLTDGDKVKIELILRGRERRHEDLARTIINNFVKKLNALVPTRIEQSLSILGGRLSLVVSKK